MRRSLVVVAAALLAPTALAREVALHPQLSATLLGKNEIPRGSGSPTGRGTVNVTLNVKKGTVCWTFTLAGVSKPTAAHIHRGRAGSNGKPFIPLGQTYRTKGCTTAAKSAIAAVESNPSGYYVNVHNGRYPSGVVRGQLVVRIARM